MECLEPEMEKNGSFLMQKSEEGTRRLNISIPKFGLVFFWRNRKIEIRNFVATFL
jgi:hypothetical protein